MVSIGIVGGGTIGRATARSFMEHAEVKVYDALPERRTHTLQEAAGCDFVMLCLPTPQAQDLSCDTRILDLVIENLPKTLNIVIRSTVPIGFTDKYNLNGYTNIVHWPEFLTARCSITDAQLPARNIVGGAQNSCKTNLGRLLFQRFPGVPVLYCSSAESEMAKLMCNSFFAHKISFFNEMHRLAEAVGADWDQVLRAVLSDGRISHSHTSVPGPDGKFGFGGACLPKDLANLLTSMREVNVDCTVSQAVLDRNWEDRNRELRCAVRQSTV